MGAREILTADKTKIAPRPQPVIAPLNVRARIGRPQPKGLPVINMSFNECPFGPSAPVAEAIVRAARRANRYGDPSCAQLRQVLAQRNGIPPDNIICGNGSEELLDVIGRVFAGKGDEIVISQYGYIQFPIVANRVGATLVRAPEKNFTSDADTLLASITPRTKIVFLANPNNPTGTLMPMAELERLAENLPETVVLVIDIAYGEFAGFDYCAEVHELAGRFSNVAVTRTFSKAYGLAGLRAGWCHAPEWMMPLLYAGRGMGTVNALAQAAALAALDDMDTVRANTSLIVAERDRVAGALDRIGFETLASKANFLLVRPPNPARERTEMLADHLFDDAGILVNLTREAGLENFFRFSLSLPEHNDQLIECLARLNDMPAPVR